MDIDMNIDKFFSDMCDKESSGNLTIGEALMGRYYRLMEGEHAGRVVIKSHDKIDGDEIVRFANGLTWIELSKIKDCKCERTYPTFTGPSRSVDYSKSTWYNDNSNVPQHHSW